MFNKHCLFLMKAWTTKHCKLLLQVWTFAFYCNQFRSIVPCTFECTCIIHALIWALLETLKGMKVLTIRTFIWSDFWYRLFNQAWVRLLILLKPLECLNISLDHAIIKFHYSFFICLGYNSGRPGSNKANLSFHHCEYSPRKGGDITDTKF